jgi:hypothetical protein
LVSCLPEGREGGQHLFVCLFFFFYSFVHMYIHCLGHFSIYVCDDSYTISFSSWMISEL